MLIVEHNAQEYMRSTILKGEPILHIHSLRYYLYTIYIFWTLIRVNDVGFDVWLMICKSLWNEALLLSTSITAVVLVSNVSKLEALAGWILSGEDFFLFFFNVFVFQRWAMGGYRGILDCVLSCCSSNLTDICKSPISREYSHGEEAVCGLETLAGCRLIVEACSCLRGDVCLYVYGCIGHAWGMWMIDMAPGQGSHQRLLLKSTTVQVISK